MVYCVMLYGLCLCWLVLVRVGLKFFFFFFFFFFFCVRLVCDFVCYVVWVVFVFAVV